MKKKEKNNSNNKLLMIIIVVLIIIIILLCLTKCEKKGDVLKIPTGNIDVFNIEINCNNKNNDCQINVDNNEKNNNTTNNNSRQKKDNNKIDTTDNNVLPNNEETIDNININIDDTTKENEIPVFDEDEDKEIIGKVFVDDQNGDYVYQQRLNIFNNAAFEYTNKIAPGVSNTYNFRVNNDSNVDFKYFIEMYEESEYKINLKYRLKRNGNYVIGNDSNWVSADELKTAYSKLEQYKSDDYSLDWKWFDSDYDDTIAGENMTSEYKLNIRIYFEAI